MNDKKIQEQEKKVPDAEALLKKRSSILTKIGEIGATDTVKAIAEMIIDALTKP